MNVLAGAARTMTDDEVREEPPKGSDEGQEPDPYAVEFAEDRRADPAMWRRFQPNGRNFLAQHLATNYRDVVIRGATPPWNHGRWGASTHKIRGKWDVKRRRFKPEWELWVAFEPRTPESAEPGGSQAVDEDPGQPAFPFDNY